MKKILLFLSLSLLLFNVSGQILFDENSGGLINGEEWYSFGNSRFSFSYYPVEAYAEDPSLDTEDREYLGIGNAHYADEQEASFGLSGDPENNFIRITFSAGSGLYPTSLEVRLRTIDEKLFTAYLYDQRRPGFEEETVTIPLSEFYNIDSPGQKATASDIAGFSTIQFMFGFYIGDINAGFTIHKAELLKAKTTRTVIYDGSTTALVNGDEWYIYGNTDDVVKRDHPLRLDKIDTWDIENSYVGVGNARYTSEGRSSFGLSGDPSSSFIEIKASGYTNYNSNLEIRLKAGEKEYSYNFNSYKVLNFEDRVFTIPVSGLRTTANEAITSVMLEQADELGFVFGFADIDYDIFFEVNEVAFVSTEFCVHPDKPVFATELINVCVGGGDVAVSIEGALNDADDWFWYTEGCGEAPFGQGASILATLNDVSTLYVRGEGSSECDLKGECASIDVANLVVDFVADMLQLTYLTREVCEESTFSFEAISEYASDETIFQWYLNDEPYGAPGKETTVVFEGLQVGDKIKASMSVDVSVCANDYYFYSEEVTMAACGTVTSVFAKAEGIRNAYVSGGNLHMQVTAAEAYGDIQVTNATGVILGRASNVNLKEKVTVPVAAENGLIIVNLITDKGIYNQKLMIR